MKLFDIFKRKPKVSYVVKYVVFGDPTPSTAAIFKDIDRAHQLIGKRMLEEGAWDTYRFYIEEIKG